jgi:hypothetical protein
VVKWPGHFTHAPTLVRASRTVGQIQRTIIESRASRNRKYSCKYCGFITYRCRLLYQYPLTVVSIGLLPFTSVLVNLIGGDNS